MKLLTSFFENVGEKSRLLLTEIGGLARLFQNFLYWSFVAPAAGKKVGKSRSFGAQLVFVGNGSLGIVLLVGASVGAVLALQAAYQLKQFGAIMYTGALVSVSMMRELGPVITAIVIAGRVGASITAELGTMKVSEEVDALVTMGIPSIPYLVVPRILAIVIMLPCLTILANLIGIIGGFLVGTLSLGLDGHLFWQESFKALVAKDVLTGMAKSFVFAILIGLIATFKGMSVEGGAEGVGRATTQSVVLSIIAIIFADCLLTAFFYYMLP